MKTEFLDLPTWEFEIDEVSAGVYKITGRNIFGNQVSATGLDPDALLERGRKDAARIDAEVASLKKKREST